MAVNLDDADFYEDNFETIIHVSITNVKSAKHF